MYIVSRDTIVRKKDIKCLDNSLFDYHRIVPQNCSGGCRASKRRPANLMQAILGTNQGDERRHFASLGSKLMRLTVGIPAIRDE